jgi:hypothetical protein
METAAQQAEHFDSFLDEEFATIDQFFDQAFITVQEQYEIQRNTALGIAQTQKHKLNNAQRQIAQHFSELVQSRGKLKHLDREKEQLHHLVRELRDLLTKKDLLLSQKEERIQFLEQQRNEEIEKIKQKEDEIRRREQDNTIEEETRRTLREEVRISEETVRKYIEVEERLRTERSEHESVRSHQFTRITLLEDEVKRLTQLLNEYEEDYMYYENKYGESPSRRNRRNKRQKNKRKGNADYSDDEYGYTRTEWIWELFTMIDPEYANSREQIIRFESLEKILIMCGLDLNKNPDLRNQLRRFEESGMRWEDFQEIIANNDTPLIEAVEEYADRQGLEKPEYFIEEDGGWDKSSVEWLWNVFIASDPEHAPSQNTIRYSSLEKILKQIGRDLSRDQVLRELLAVYLESGISWEEFRLIMNGPDSPVKEAFEDLAEDRKIEKPVIKVGNRNDWLWNVFNLIDPEFASSHSTIRFSLLERLLKLRGIDLNKNPALRNELVPFMDMGINWEKFLEIMSGPRTPLVEAVEEMADREGYGSRATEWQWRLFKLIDPEFAATQRSLRFSTLDKLLKARGLDITRNASLRNELSAYIDSGMSWESFKIIMNGNETELVKALIAFANEMGLVKPKCRKGKNGKKRRNRRKKKGGVADGSDDSEEVDHDTPNSYSVPNQFLTEDTLVTKNVSGPVYGNADGSLDELEGWDEEKERILLETNKITIKSGYSSMDEYSDSESNMDSLSSPGRSTARNRSATHRHRRNTFLSRMEQRLEERLRQLENFEEDFFLNIPRPKTAEKQVLFYERKYLFLKKMYREQMEELVKYELQNKDYRVKIANSKEDTVMLKKQMIKMNKEKQEVEARYEAKVQQLEGRIEKLKITKKK